MNDRITEIALEASDPKTGWLDRQKFAELVVRESIIDFYRRYLDLNSNEDITEQVNRYVRDNFGVEQK